MSREQYYEEYRSVDEDLDDPAGIRHTVILNHGKNPEPLNSA